MTDLFVTVEGIYTPEQKAARRRFHQAYKDAEAGKVGAQYIEDTDEVKAAKERFFKFFQFVLDGMLYKLVPKPGYNVIPEEIADFYIKDEQDVAAEKLKFDKLFRDALNGDAASAIAVVALEEAISNNDGDLEAAAKELDETLNAIVDVVEDEYSDASKETEDDTEEYQDDTDDSDKSKDEDNDFELPEIPPINPPNDFEDSGDSDDIDVDEDSDFKDSDDEGSDDYIDSDDYADSDDYGDSDDFEDSDDYEDLDL